jgi:hypothetical protein
MTDRISPDQLRLILAQAKAGLAMQPDMPIQLRCDVVVKLIESIPTSAPESELDELRYDLIKRLRYWSDEHGRTDCGAAADQIYLLGVQSKERAEWAQKWHALVQGLAVMLGVNSATGLDELSKGISEAIQRLQSTAVLVERLGSEVARAQANEMQDCKDMIRVNMERDALASQVAQLRDELTAANLQKAEVVKRLAEILEMGTNTVEQHPKGYRWPWSWEAEKALQALGVKTCELNPQTGALRGYWETDNELAVTARQKFGLRGSVGSCDELAALATPSARMQQDETSSTSQLPPTSLRVPMPGVKPARDAEHCDFPDCEQHWMFVASQQRQLLAEWLHEFGSTSKLSARTRVTLKNSPLEPSSTTKHQPSAFDQTSPPLWDSTATPPHGDKGDL